MSLIPKIKNLLLSKKKETVKQNTYHRNFYLSIYIIFVAVTLKLISFDMYSLDYP